MTIIPLFVILLHYSFLAPSILHSRGSIAMDENDYNLALKLILKALEINEINKLSVVENDQINVSNILISI